MIYLKKITENSWLIADTEISGNVGLLSHNSADGYFILLGDQKSTFDTKEELNEFFDCDILETVVSNVAAKIKTNYINGFPVDLAEIYLAEDEDSELPVYRNSPKSDTVRCAGYYCINYANGWLDSYCPRIKTLNNFEYTGPFKTRVQAQLQVTMKKNERS